ncbi:hypothetical protein AOLI_G00015200 [Acnodon oligacanthus]
MTKSGNGSCSRGLITPSPAPIPQERGAEPLAEISKPCSHVLQLCKIRSCNIHQPTEGYDSRGQQDSAGFLMVGAAGKGSPAASAAPGDVSEAGTATAGYSSIGTAATGSCAAGRAAATAGKATAGSATTGPGLRAAGIVSVDMKLFRAGLDEMFGHFMFMSDDSHATLHSEVQLPDPAHPHHLSAPCTLTSPKTPDA